jgi:hypothetical protein
MPIQSALPIIPGKACCMSQPKTASPCRPASSTLGMARTMALTMTQPKIPDK